MNAHNYRQATAHEQMIGCNCINCQHMQERRWSTGRTHGQLMSFAGCDGNQ